MRQFKTQTLELLAPAGNFEIFKDVVKTKCDAIYFGGQSLNMRMIRKGFNFTNDQIKEAITMANAMDKRTYITVNNLISDLELDEAKRFLTYLNEVSPSGLIVQDFSILELIREMGLNLPIHSSVMMNVHNIPMVETLKKYGVERVVLSREMSLAEAKILKEATGIETEYFTHGDMCIAHGSQCYHSSMVFGMSSNRGRCLKPCRWGYTLKGEEEVKYPMAVKDLSMYEHLPEMIEAGITSYKLEGRMREADFITSLINDYGDALDRYIEDPDHYDRHKASEKIYETRKRDLSTAYAFGKPGAENLNTRYEGTGKFYSTGKVFSVPTKEADLSIEDLNHIRSHFETLEKPATAKALMIKVNNAKQAEVALLAGADHVVLSGDVFKPDEDWTIEEVKRLTQMANELGVKIWLGFPRMTSDREFKYIDAKKDWPCHGYVVGNLGALSHVKSFGKPVHVDFTMNTYNHKTLGFYKREGADSVTLSIEMKYKELKALLESETQVSLIAYGRLSTMYFEHDFFSVLGVDEDTLYFENEAGTFEIRKDQMGRTHLISEKTLNLSGLSDVLPVKMIQIEGQVMTNEAIERVIRYMKSEAKAPLMGTNPAEMTLGALRFD